MCMGIRITPSCKARLRDPALEVSTCQLVIRPFEEQHLKLRSGKYGSANRGLKSEEEGILYIIYVGV